MPPSHRSSSSHHSSSHRSSSHSHSSHSHSSHSSSSYGRSSSYSGGSYSRSSYTAPVNRPRVNQPHGFIGTPRLYKCKSHDYSYYNTNWFDEDSCKSYRRGFYDENGQFYDALIIKDKDVYESHFQCVYCGTEKKAVWKEGSIPTCDNCGANFMEMYTNPITDEVSSTNVNVYNSGYDRKKRASSDKTMGCILKVIVFYFIASISLGLLANIAPLVLMGLNIDIPKLIHNDKTSTTIEIVNDEAEDKLKSDNVDRFGTVIYVESIDRTLEWSDEYLSYYDPVSDCYVAYSTDEEPFAWQYWYEGISSDYGDYGWMEYELDEDQWYIEIGDGRWTKLPLKYDTSDLWYITGDLAGSSYEEDIDITLLGRSICDDRDHNYVYNWDSDMKAYYNEQYNCYFWYNADYVEVDVWQYYYSQLIGAEENMTGWFEYDRDEDCWYYETTDGDYLLWEHDNQMWYIGKAIYCFDTEDITICN